MKRYLTNNIGLKIMSIIIAALLWLLIININDPIVTETFYEIPVRIANEQVVTSKGYQYNIEAGDKISVKVRGKRSVVDNLVESGFVAIADFTSLSAMYHATITVTYPGYDENNLEITPKTEVMSIKLEDSETLPFNVRIVTNGDLREGYYISETMVRLSPTIVQISGAKTQVSNIEEVVIEVDVKGKKESFETTAVPVAYDKNGNIVDSMKISYDPQLIQVSVTVVPTKTIPLEVVTTGEPAYGYHAFEPEFAPNAILVAAEEEVLAGIDKLTIPCDISNLTEQLDTEFNIQEALLKEFGDGVTLVDANKSVGVLIKIEKLERMDFPIGQKEIEVRGLPAGMTLKFQNPDTLQLKLLGRTEDLEALTLDDLKPYINIKDLAGVQAGTYTISIRSDYVGKVLVEPGSTVVILKLIESEE